ncbi:DUF4380 domain-containing protein [Microbacterium sp. RD1]|uniref:DUF4380 domain-containing protein n=1 Tax=Microbacterium sp. RD1 TaxID=3457313 RepID=UPI003FA55454
MTIENLIRDGGPDLYRIRTAELALTFVPDVGGRLLSLVTGDRELLWRNPSYIDGDLVWTRPRATWPDGTGDFTTWANIGGAKSWPAPQGWNDAEREWAGPPDPVLDAGAYSWECVETPAAIAVVLRSGYDPRSGLRIERRFEIRTTGRAFTETVTFRNESDRARTWSIWEVAQIAVPSAGGVPAEAVVSVEDGRMIDLGTHRGGADARHSGRERVIPIVAGVLKRGFPSASGSLAYREDGRTLLELHFTPVPGGRYPDQGSRAELWMQSPQHDPLPELGGLHPDAWLIELEILSPLHELGPGEEASLRIDWLVGGEDAA